jgi:hypothetical protein
MPQGGATLERAAGVRHYLMREPLSGDELAFPLYPPEERYGGFLRFRIKYDGLFLRQIMETKKGSRAHTGSPYLALSTIIVIQLDTNGFQRYNFEGDIKDDGDQNQWDLLYVR